MATPALPSPPGQDQLITVKVLFNDSNRRFKLPLRDLRAQVFPQKLRTLLGVPADVNVILERYSDSAGCYIHLDSDNQGVYKQLYRAGKAKSKLRIKASTVDLSVPASTNTKAPVESIIQNPPRHSYLETVLSSPILVGSSENIPATITSPVPPPPTASTDTLPTGVYGRKELSIISQPHYRNFEMEKDTLRFPVISHSSPSGMFCIDCNNCGRSIANDHYHCGICENGDYDLCPACVTNGASCRGEGHWLIKRSVENGIVTNSTTETVAPQQPQVQEIKPLDPSPAQEPIAETVACIPAPAPAPTPAPAVVLQKDEANQEEKPICNGCCRETEESNLVRCNQCEDYDLCLRCLLRNKHGHHPAHSFSLGSDRNFCLKNLILSRCLPGRRFQHAAICDGCEKNIVGTRHKCLDCPDWDYCPECIVDASQTHPRHRFAPVYEALAEQQPLPEVHFGIFCDGPLCKDKPAQSYIKGIRYKCAVCDDIDFCANCEALPTHTHNRTHPLVKFKTPVRTVTVSTVTDDITLGDQTCTVASPSVESPVSDCTIEVSGEKQPIVEQAPVEVDATKPEAPCSAKLADYQAYFMRDTIADGTKLLPDTCFRQTWTLYNPGPNAWPVGSDVRFSGGDAMFNVDSAHPSGVESIHLAMKSNSLTAAVEPGSTADFTVNLRSSQREGTAISYWRLKLPNGTPIGHRLWCDIQVQESAEPVVAKSEESETPTEDTEMTGSRMIFPKLEKESPETSTHEAITAVRPPAVSTASEGDILEDVESLTLDETDTDGGFLTDEEYDVLDASDHEFLEAKQSLP
ncbi:hypothetical protein N7490_009323 [Penicillium lividum]|nr:hypothetical protein N7490_009323 [Penicillium lividum]